MITASSVASQYELGDIKLEYWVKRFIRSSSSAAFHNGFALSVRLSCVAVMVCMTSFTATSCDLEISDGVLSFFCKVYFLFILLGKHFIVMTVEEMSSAGLTCLDA